MRNLRRRKAPSQQAQGHSVDVSRFGLDEEVDRLRRQKRELMMELVNLREQQHNTRVHLQEMEQRLKGIQIKQQQMLSFLARAMKNPNFIHQLLQQKEKRKVLEEAMTRKRRLIEQGTSCIGESSIAGEGRGSVKVEPLELSDYEFGVSELEMLAMEMQGFGTGRTVDQEERPEGQESQEGVDSIIDEEFWEALLFSEKFPGQLDFAIASVEDKD